MTPISRRICCSGAPRPPSRSEVKPVAHPTTTNLTASLVVSVTLHASSGCRLKFLRRALTRNYLAALLAGLTQRAPCESSATPRAGLTPRAPCESSATPRAGLTQNTLPGSRHAPCRASGETLPVANAVSAPEQGLAKPLRKALGGNRSSTRKPEQSVREPERSVQEPEQSDEGPRVRVGEPLPSESKDQSRQDRKTGRARIGRHPHQNRRTAAPESEDQPHLIAQTPTWRTSKPQFGSRICILGVAGLPYNL